jgi:hypothetical protein
MLSFYEDLKPDIGQRNFELNIIHQLNCLKQMELIDFKMLIQFWF